MASPNITVSLVKFRDALIQRGTARSISWEWAHLIKALDNKNEYCYVEFPDSQEEYPLLWHITDWLDTAAHRQHLKKASENYRQESYVMQRNLARLIQAMQNITGLDKDSATAFCSKLMLRKDKDNFFKTMQCKFEIFIELDSDGKPVIQTKDYSKTQ